MPDVCFKYGTETIVIIPLAPYALGYISRPSVCGLDYSFADCSVRGMFAAAVEGMCGQRVRTMPDPCRFRRLGRRGKDRHRRGIQGSRGCESYRVARQSAAAAVDCQIILPLWHSLSQINSSNFPWDNSLAHFATIFAPTAKGRKQARCFASHRTPLGGCLLVFRESVRHERICMAVPIPCSLFSIPTSSMCFAG